MEPSLPSGSLAVYASVIHKMKSTYPEVGDIVLLTPPAESIDTKVFARVVAGPGESVMVTYNDLNQELVPVPRGHVFVSMDKHMYPHGPVPIGLVDGVVLFKLNPAPQVIPGTPKEVRLKFQRIHKQA
jgi:hypothetical protein